MNNNTLYVVLLTNAKTETDFCLKEALAKMLELECAIRTRTLNITLKEIDKGNYWIDNQGNIRLGEAPYED